MSIDDIDKINVDEIVNEAADGHYIDLIETLQHLFGAVAVRGLTRWEQANLRAVLASCARQSASKVHGAHIHQRADDAQQASWNLLRGVLAGAANERRNLTGEPIDEFTKKIVGITDDEEGQP